VAGGDLPGDEFGELPQLDQLDDAAAVSFEKHLLAHLLQLAMSSSTRRVYLPARLTNSEEVHARRKWHP